MTQQLSFYVILFFSILYIHSSKAYYTYNYKLHDKILDASACNITATEYLIGFLCPFSKSPDFVYIYIYDVDNFIAQKFAQGSFVQEQFLQTNGLAWNVESFDKYAILYSQGNMRLYTINRYQSTVSFKTQDFIVNSNLYEISAKLSHQVVAYYQRVKSTSAYQLVVQLLNKGDLKVYNFDSDLKLNGMGMYVSSDRSQTQIYIGMKRTNEAFFSLMIFNIKVYENTSIELTFDKLIKIGSQQCASTISSSDYLLILGCPSFNNQLGLMTTLRRNDLYEINTINGALNNTQLLGKQIKILFRPEIQENQETVFFSSQNKSDNQGFIGVMQVFHDRRAYNFTYEWYDIQSLNQYNEKVFGYSFAINNKGDTFSTSLVQQYQSVGYVKFCMSNQYYFDGSCQQCGGSNTFNTIQLKKSRLNYLIFRNIFYKKYLYLYEQVSTSFLAFHFYFPCLRKFLRICQLFLVLFCKTIEQQTL